ncbi:hypothetical protein OG439_28970 [Amycolatopsis sp. NBC_01307]|uniref:hypothetical protein n=1 Tax=Amycolatopsis sp. NBC_01307 TaxID=2903561 RepID=UPI002E141A51|nr:hypothetical protein OG439_28970 [Amycolatopsis sp. NBC_01307]
MTTPAQHDRDQSAARVGRLKQDLAGRLDTAPEPGAEDAEPMDRLVAAAVRLLDAEADHDEAVHRLVAAELGARHAATQRAVVFFAAGPVLAGLVSAALVLFGVLSPGWLPLLVPLFAAGMWVGFAPVREVPAVLRERTRAARAGTLAAVFLVVALLPWPSSTANVVSTILAVLGTAGAIAGLVRESRIP